MSEAVALVFPGDLDTPTGGYAYDRRMAAELEAERWQVTRVALAADFPFPSHATLAEADAALAALPEGALALVDGLAFAAMPDVARRHAERLRLVALVHHPLALETGLDAETAERLAASERAALASARGVVATSRFTARQLAADYGVAPDRIAVVTPGTDPGPPARGRGQPPLILTVAALVPRKGHALLIQALAGVRDLPWRCRLVGALDRSPATVQAVRAAIAEAGLGDRIALAGEVADVRAEMAAADLFVLPSRHEGYGMAFAEALSQGLPVVGCTAGAVGDLVPPEAGLLVPVDDLAALQAALRALLSDPTRLHRLAEGARDAGRALPSWRDQARRMADALRRAA